ncbi:hypothetical protein WJX72_000458 [[Myrmecia] bisecta]|uniref:Uncharacterized protein n=1 Tax=[Myrmecia] bisecta TaxID=41462 RepID=A0AAW1PX43_9CHLO
MCDHFVASYILKLTKSIVLTKPVLVAGGQSSDYVLKTVVTDVIRRALSCASSVSSAGLTKGLVMFAMSSLCTINSATLAVSLVDRSLLSCLAHKERALDSRLDSLDGKLDLIGGSLGKGAQLEKVLVTMTNAKLEKLQEGYEVLAETYARFLRVIAGADINIANDATQLFGVALKLSKVARRMLEVEPMAGGAWDMADAAALARRYVQSGWKDLRRCSTA